MEKFYEKSVIYYVFFEVSKKVCDFGDFTKIVLESFKND
jgi:hypothetical protein